MVTYIPAKQLVTRTKNQEWFGTDYNMNIYRGCSHGCIYCDSRSECYRIENFDQVCVKENALLIIRDDLRRKVKSGVVATGSMSDPYNPLEKELQLTRHALELIEAYGFGVAIDTKSDLIVRDSDILKGIMEQAPVLCKITITTAADQLAQKIEPQAPSSSRRFAAIRKLTDQGLFAGILLMPVLPYLTDTKGNIKAIILKAQECGARFIYPLFGVTLRQNQRDWYLQKLEERFPGEGLREKYEKRYGYAYQCSSPRARELWEYLAEECEKAGLLYTMDQIKRAYKQNYEYTQLRLF